MSESPFGAATKAICVRSGDQRGKPSYHGVRVTRRTVPSVSRTYTSAFPGVGPAEPVA
jgi:hypothetical protein